MEMQPFRNGPDSTQIKGQFNEVLMKHIKRLIEIETSDASISFNISTIVCLLLIVERENEIKSSPDSSLKRYTRETLLDDISDVGVEIDDELMASVQALTQHGYMVTDADNMYNAQIQAFALVGFLDNLFPGMRGMNLVGYILQTMDEVVSGRKELKEALAQLDQTLLSKGIPLSGQTLDTLDKGAKEEKAAIKPTKKNIKDSLPSSMPKDLKKEYAKKLTKLRSASGNRNVNKSVYTTGRALGQPQIKELGPKSAAEEVIKPKETAIETEEITAMECDAHKTEKDDAERAALEMEKKAAMEHDIRKAEMEAAERATLEMEKKAAEFAQREAKIKAAEISARDSEIRVKEAEIRAREAEIAIRESEAKCANIKQEDAPQDKTDKKGTSVDIEDQIASFQEQIAIPCPICRTGRIIADKTEKDREYFSCSDTNCGFISWEKPYPFECPLCKNMFLIEFTAKEGHPGLKCPKATCSYQQDHLSMPCPDAAAEPKKRKRVRRVRRKK